MTAADRSIVFIVAGDPHQLTGGYLYDARIAAGLRARGHGVDTVGLAGTFPHADAVARRALDDTLTAIADASVVIIDGLTMGGLLDVVTRHALRLAVVALVHHPLANETGLDRVPAYAARVARAIERAGLGQRLRLRGPVDPQSLHRAYAASDVFVLASHYEGYGRVIAEALAHGLPVVTTTGGALAQTVPPGCGLSVPPGDVAALGDALATLIADHDVRARARAAAIAARARLRDWQQAADEFAAMLAPHIANFSAA